MRVLGLFSAGMATLALAVAFARPAVGIAVALLVLGTLAGFAAWGLRWLEYDEFSEAGAAIASVARRGRNRLRVGILARELERRIAEAPSMSELDSMLSEAAPELGVAHMTVCRESARRRIALASGADANAFYRVDFPVLDLHDADPSDPVVLRVYGSAPHRNAERAAHLLAPAVRDRLVAWPAARVSGYLPHRRAARGAQVATEPDVHPTTVPA